MPKRRQVRVDVQELALKLIYKMRVNNFVTLRNIYFRLLWITIALRAPL